MILFISFSNQIFVLFLEGFTSVWLPYKLYNASIANVKNDFKRGAVGQLPWAEAVPTQFTHEACTLFDRLTKTVWDVSCSWALPSICIIEPDITFKLVGLCGDSILDKNYILKNSWK